MLVTLAGHESIGGAESHAQVSAGDLELNLKDSLEHYLECSDDPDFVEVRMVQLARVVPQFRRS